MAMPKRIRFVTNLMTRLDARQTIGGCGANLFAQKLIAPTKLATFVLISYLIAAGLGSCARRGTNSASLNQQLLLAAKSGDTGVVRQLLKKGANIEAKDEGGSTPLALAADFGHGDTVKLLLEEGADIVAGHLDGEAALVEAAMEGNVKKVELMLERGADLKAKNEALFAATESAPLVMEVPAAEAEHIRSQQKQVPNGAAEFPFMDHAQTARSLLEKGATIEARDEGGSTPLIQAAAHGETSVVKLLLEKGADIKATDNQGDTTLLVAACDCAVATMPDTYDIMKVLLQKKANIEARDKRGGTALMAAAGWGRTNIVELLLDKGARIEARDNNGDTALILAASKGGYEDVQIVKLLLTRGADARATNMHGQTALALAVKNGRTNIVPLLRETTVKSP
jgi:ankyrin repeat protein